MSGHFPPMPNPAVKGPSTGGLRPLAAAPYVERSASTLKLSRAVLSNRMEFMMFMRTLGAAISVSLMVGCASTQNKEGRASKELTCKSGEVSLSVPEEWKVDDAKCIFSGSMDTQVFVGAAPAGEAGQPTAGLRMVSALAATVVSFKLGVKPYGETVEVSLENSRGIQKTFQDESGRHVVLLVVEQQGAIGQVMLVSATDVWNSSKSELQSILNSVKLKRNS